jgi:hypothetical protein
VLPGGGLHGQTLGVCFEPSLPLLHENLVLDHVLVQHVLPSFPRDRQQERLESRCVMTRG